MIKPPSGKRLHSFVNRESASVSGGHHLPRRKGKPGTRFSLDISRDGYEEKQLLRFDHYHEASQFITKMNRIQQPCSKYPERLRGARGISDVFEVWVSTEIR